MIVVSEVVFFSRKVWEVNLQVLKYPFSDDSG